ncbi:hypothetical protein RHSIM_Rhsim01G0069500 [Rhododendron simsii]|uniref:RNase H type-1 domain-containing protein n=1 Tax=Rhododendron simsii TaxID=118357 RepID=A0A834LU85_RHOSS|nr:hypothetical protein RHSIM_Rhsim01G0069500 [Rhododendron simsii]
MGSLKAPGPDGFPGVFFQKYWDQVKDSVCSMVKNFFEGSANIEKLKKTNVVLIPKIPHPETVSQFRPISLCNFGYKIISKVDINHGRIKVSLALAAEAWAVRIAVLMARAWGLQRATIETDCEVLVHLLQAASNHKNWHSACNLQDNACGRRGNKEESGDESQELWRKLIAPVAATRSLSCDGEIDAALRHVRAADVLSSPVISLHLFPTFDSATYPPFLALTKSIVYQQLAYKAGTSIYTRFISICGSENDIVPTTVLAVTPPQLHQIYVSGRKASCLHDGRRKCNPSSSFSSLSLSLSLSLRTRESWGK